MSRLKQLQIMLERTPADPFLLYGIGMEHKKAGDVAAALEYLDHTIAVDAAYCYAYYQKGQVLESAGKTDDARAAYLAGIAAAKGAGDSHAQSELQAALDLL